MIGNKIQRLAILRLQRERSKKMYTFKFDGEWTDKVVEDTQSEADIAYLTHEIDNLPLDTFDLSTVDSALGEEVSTMTEKENKTNLTIQALCNELSSLQVVKDEALKAFELTKAMEIKNHCDELQARMDNEKAGLEETRLALRQLQTKKEKLQQEHKYQSAYQKVKEYITNLPSERVSKILLHEDLLSSHLGHYLEKLKEEYIDDYGKNTQPSH